VEKLSWTTVISEVESHVIEFTLACSGRVFPPYIRQKWTDPNQTWQEETTSQRNPQENLGPIACVTPHAAKPRPFFSAYTSPACLTPKKTSDFGVKSRDPTANLCTSSKFRIFTRRRRDRKSGIFGVLRWVFWLSDTALHRTSNLHTKKHGYRISGDVLDVPFWSKRPPKIAESQWGSPNLKKISISKICFL